MRKVKAMAFVTKLNTARGQYVYLVRLKNKQGCFWHYLLVDNLKLPLFLKAATRNEMDVAEYGKILYSGWGVAPPENITEKINKEYSS
jgi:hypothetical protein